MGQTQLAPMPRALQYTSINSVSTAAVEICPAQAGKVVCYWGCTSTNGTSLTLQSNDTPISAVLATDGLQHDLPAGNPLTDKRFPRYQTNVGEALKVKPGASGLGGDFYYTVEDPKNLG